jgi:AraC-like DNA-binding protein
VNSDSNSEGNQTAFSALANGVTLMHARFLDHTFERHSHDCFVIGATTYGIQRFRSKGRQYDSQQGDLVLFNPDEDHDGKSGTADGFRYTIWYVPVDLVAISLGVDSGPARGHYFSSPNVTDPKMAGTFMTLSASLTETPCEALRLETLMHSFFRTVLGRHGERNRVRVLPSDGASPAGLARVKDYIHACYANDLTVSDLASVAGLSRAHLTRAFSAAFHMPPHVYLNAVRITQAQKLMRLGVPLTTVALECGFADQSHFTRRFKGTVGATPAGWRRMTGTSRMAGPAS